MASANASGVVTIDRAYFDALLRRAEFQHHSESSHGDFQNNSPPDASVYISRAEYDGLQLIAHQYANLKQNLISAGVAEENLMVLSQDCAYASNRKQQVVTFKSQAFRFDPANAQPFKPIDHPLCVQNSSRTDVLSRSNTSNSAPAYKSHYRYANEQGRGLSSKKLDWDGADLGSDEEDPPGSAHCELAIETDNGHAASDRRTVAEGPQYARMCKRTIALFGLSPQTTHEDVTKVVRGGMLLDIYIRDHDHTGFVSFLHEEDATHFYEYGRKNDIYIKNKRVFIRWGDRHFHLPGHVAHKVATGATRNLVMRRCDPGHTEESIREDLDHIHNLIVIKVEFLRGSCFIKTNSVHNAMFARTCMMSRGKYKGSRIEWDEDECDRPFPVMNKVPFKAQSVRPAKSLAAGGSKNRFATLRLDDSDNDLGDDDPDSSSEFPASNSIDISA